MSERDPNEAAMDGEHGSYDSLLSPCETYEGSRHYAASLDIEVDLDDLELALDDDVGARASKETVVMSPALLAQLRAELMDEAAREPIATRPTRRSMPAVRLEEQG